MKRKNKRMLMIGFFGYQSNQLDGQTVKTRSNYELLKTKYPIAYFDTEVLKSNKFEIFTLLKHIIRNRIIFYVGAQNNLKAFFPFLFLISKVANKKINYLTVGGWLNEWLEKKPKFYTVFLRNINKVLVQTTDLKNELENKNFRNVQLIPNFRIIPENYKPNIKNSSPGKLNLVFMSRVMAEKGIFLIIEFYRQYLLNRKDFLSEITIDFYGQIHPKDENQFLEDIRLIEGINYKGFLKPEEIYFVLNTYDALLLPTYYSGEGFPGAIIDAYISGIPVITTKWKQIPEFVDDGETGFLIDYDIEDLYAKIKELANDVDLQYEMKRLAFLKSEEYSSNKALEILETSL